MSIRDRLARCQRYLLTAQRYANECGAHELAAELNYTIRCCDDAKRPIDRQLIAYSIALKMSDDKFVALQDRREARGQKGSVRGAFCLALDALIA